MAEKAESPVAEFQTRPGETTVRFTKSHRSWNRGVMAGFPDSMAQDLVKKGLAVVVDPVRRDGGGSRMVRK